ncbi:LLM class flavin-dependent oxidoreductase [Bradyrhizobium sp. 147]|uniref:LLM class flavin-dependent oxidoreductase n=1 Tax=Bradyrhizobium sp. 147 TaxID=2782623 RepID=UPI001FFB6327|nr:LLM class flavin-dependent oxidoreductase [Bradyrhizobium sp. 147]
MVLNLFLSAGGYSVGGWRRERSRSNELTSLSLYRDLARLAEQAKFDAIFVPDSVRWDPERTEPRPVELEPITLLSALAGVTEKIGLIGTVSISFTEPANVVRYFTSLDHLSDGRAAWNIVVSSAGDGNYSVKLPPRDDRYAMADEYLRVVTALWDSWEDDAVVNDRKAGIWLRPDRVHRIDHQGKYFSVEGPALIQRGPQGWPVLVQAGSSPAGVDFAARWAELVYTAQPDLEHARIFYQTIKRKAAEAGRDPSHIKVLPGLLPIIGETEEAANALAGELADLMPVEAYIPALRSVFEGVDVTGLDLNQPIPLDRIPPLEQIRMVSRFELFRQLAVDKRYSLRDLLRVAARSYGHPSQVGTAAQVADEMERWFSAGACDGFNLQMAYAPGGLQTICDQLVPELVRRGLFHREYEGNTFRDRLGLPRPRAGSR